MIYQCYIYTQLRKCGSFIDCSRRKKTFQCHLHSRVLALYFQVQYRKEGGGGLDRLPTCALVFSPKVKRYVLSFWQLKQGNFLIMKAVLQQPPPIRKINSESFLQAGCLLFSPSIFSSTILFSDGLLIPPIISKLHESHIQDTEWGTAFKLKIASETVCFSSWF